MTSQSRRRILALSAVAAAAAIRPSLAAAPARSELRIGFQKYGTLTILKARGTLDRRLAASGIDIRWTEFPAGPQLLEALNVGSIDFGTVGEAPPIFAQAAGADLLYIANQPPAPTAEAILVAAASPLKSVQELKGKRVALNKGSNVHYLLVRALARAGLPYTDIETVFLPPADARAAFERGSVDAWAIWDPFLAAAEIQAKTRVLTDGTGLVSNHQFFLAARPYAEGHPEVIVSIIDELAQLDAWAARNTAEVAQLLSPQLGLDVPVVERAAARFAYGIRSVNETVAAEQQKIGDAFFQLKLIPKPIRVADALPSGTLAAALSGRAVTTGLR